MNYFFPIVLILNTLWFGLAFRFFSTQSQKAAKLLVKKEDRASPVFLIIVHSIKFLGGMNFSLSLFALILLFSDALFPNPNQKALFALIFMTAHFSQFFYNIPHAWNEYRQKEALWVVLNGRMFFIFVVDALLAFLNFLCAVLFLIIT